MYNNGTCVCVWACLAGQNANRIRGRISRHLRQKEHIIEHLFAKLSALSRQEEKERRKIWRRSGPCACARPA